MLSRPLTFFKGGPVVKLSVLLVLGEALLLTGLWMLLPALALVAAGGQLVAVALARRA